jgi:hypothetical protein
MVRRPGPWRCVNIRFDAPLPSHCRRPPSLKPLLSRRLVSDEADRDGECAAVLGQTDAT